MTNIYLDRIAGLQKVAVDIGTLQHLATSIDPAAVGAWAAATGKHAIQIHALQNAATWGALRTSPYQKSVAQHFAAGLGGKMSPTAAGDKTSKWTNFKTYLAGGVNPELNIIRDETYHAGHKLRSHLQDAGIDPDNMPRRAKAALARAARGDFSKLKQQYANDPLVLKTLEAAGKATGHPLVDIVRGTDKGVQMAEDAWKGNALTKGFGREISKKVDVSHLPKGHSQQTTGDSLAGSAAMGLATGDWVLTAANSGKALMADRGLLNKSKHLKSVTDFFDRHFVTGSIEEKLDQGLKGQKYNPLKRTFDTVFGSTPVAEAKSISNQMGLAAREANVQKHVSTAKDFARDAKEIYEQGKARVNETAQTVGTGVSATSTVHKILTESAKRREAARKAVVNQPIPEKTKMGVGLLGTGGLGLGVGAGLAGTS